MAAAGRKPELYYIGILRRRDASTEPSLSTIEITKEFHLDSFSRFTKGTAAQAMTFLAQTVAERTSPGTRQEVEEKGSHCYAYGRSDGICGIVITNADYPRMVAHSLNSKVVDDFLKTHPKSSYLTLNKTPGGGDPIKWPPLKDYITRYLEPAEADPTTRAQMELDETKVILHKTIESVLERGEKIDNLVAKSDGLSASSKMFYKQSKSQNSCCAVM